MEIPGLGRVTDPDGFGWRRSDARPVAVLRGQLCHLVLDGYDEDDNKSDFHEAITNFLSIDPAILAVAAPAIFAYYQDCNADWEPGDDEYLEIPSPSDIWRHIRLGQEPIVSRRPYGDTAVYVSLECHCDWEPEHGLQIVFRQGLSVNKVGQCNGHLTNADAYGDDRLEHVVYKSFSSRPPSN